MQHLLVPTTDTQLLIKHGVEEAQLDADLTFQLEDVAKLRNADHGTYAVLLAAAHQELDTLRGAADNSATPRLSRNSPPHTPVSVSPVGALFADTKPLTELQQATRSVLQAASPLPYVAP